MTDHSTPFHGYDNDFIRSVETNFGQNARTRRKFLEYSQGIVSTLMQAEYGIPWHQTVVAKIEDGSRKVKLMEAYALADMYGIPLDELTRGRNLDKRVQWYEVRTGDGRVILRPVWGGDSGDD